MSRKFPKGIAHDYDTSSKTNLCCLINPIDPKVTELFGLRKACRECTIKAFESFTGQKFPVGKGPSSPTAEAVVSKATK